MILRPQQIQLLALGCPATPCNGGKSKSSVQNDNSTRTLNQTPVTDGGSVGVAAENSTVSVTQVATDLDAIEKAFDFATNSRKGVSEDFSKVVNMAGDSLSFAKETARLSSNAQANATDQLSKAIGVVQENITGNKYLVTLGMILAGVVAIAAFGGQFGKVKL